MSSSSRKRARTEEPQTQLEEYAFNIFGFAYKHGIVGREKNQKLLTWPVSSKPYEKRLQEIPNVPVPSSMDLSAEERGEIEPGVSTQCLVVGLVHPDLHVEDISKLPMTGTFKGKPVGLQQPSTFYTCETPLRVVVQVTNAGVATKLYVLLEKTEGLCHPYSVSQESVFYFCEFREDSKAVEARKTAWNELVKRQSVRSAPIPRSTNSQLLTKEQIATKIKNDSPLNFANELLLLTSTPNLQRQDWIDSRIKGLLGLKDQDFEPLPLPKSIFHTFTCHSVKFGEEEADELIKEATQKWGDIGLTVDIVVCLKQGLEFAGIALDWQNEPLMRGFFAYAVRILGTAQITYKEELADLVTEVHDTAMLIIGNTGPSATSTGEANLNTLLGPVVSKLKELSASASEVSKGKERQQLPTSPTPAGGSSSSCCSSSLTAEQAFLYGASAIATKPEAFKQVVDDLIGILERLKGE